MIGEWSWVGEGRGIREWGRAGVGLMMKESDRAY